MAWGGVGVHGLSGGGYGGRMWLGFRLTVDVSCRTTAVRVIQTEHVHGNFLYELE